MGSSLLTPESSITHSLDEEMEGSWKPHIYPKTHLVPRAHLQINLHFSALMSQTTHAVIGPQCSQGGCSLSYPTGPTGSLARSLPWGTARQSTCSRLDAQQPSSPMYFSGFVLWKRSLSPPAISDYFSVRDRKPRAVRGVGRLSLYPLPSQKTCAQHPVCAHRMGCGGL